MSDKTNAHSCPIVTSLLTHDRHDRRGELTPGRIDRPQILCQAKTRSAPIWSSNVNAVTGISKPMTLAVKCDEPTDA